MVKRLEVEGLTPEVLRALYEQEGLTETEIGARFGFSQVWVNRYRKRCGIPTRSKADRIMATLPSLTDEQSRLLVGSLLGDGSLSMSSDGSAAYSERHSVAQSDYMQWKMQVLAPFASHLYPTKKVDKAGKEFHGVGFHTPSCPLFWPLYEQFYPAPKRKRVFPQNLPDLMTPLALAVWYMDDGSLMKDGIPRITFGLCAKSLTRARKALHRLGLTTVVYGTKGHQTIHFPKCTALFAELVGPHLHPTLQYKMPRVIPRRVTDKNARKLSADQAGSLYAGGLSVAEISAMFEVGASTVKRRIEQSSTSMRRSGPRTTALDKQAVLALLGDLGKKGAEWQTLAKEDQEVVVQEVLRLLRLLPFPYPEPFSEEAAAKALADVSSSLSATGDLTLSRAGLALCTSLFPNRYAAKSRGALSAWEAWHRDESLRKAIAFQLKVGDPVLPHRVLKAITMASRTPSVFRPTVAGTIYKTFCPQGGVVWDPCSGFGGRLLGAAAAGVRYIGTDVDTDTVEGNRKLAKMVGSSAEVFQCPAEKFSPPCAVCLVFTSPPYYNRELYSEVSSQSYVRYTNFAAWVEGFLRPVVQQSARSLVAGRYLLLNVADIREGKIQHPLVNRTIEVAQEEGFVLERTLQMPLASLNRKDASEPVLVFRKP